MDYRYVTIDDLRYDLKQIESLKVLNVSELSDDMVLLIHHQVTTAGHEDAPDWFKSEVEFWINLERNVAIDHQMRIEQLETRIADLEARLGYSVNEIVGYAQNG